jgi:hypothetical protein
MKAKMHAAPETPAPAELAQILPIVKQPGLEAPQLRPRVLLAIEHELETYRKQRAEGQQ